MTAPHVIAVDMPTDAVAWPEWLERQLVRDDLGQLVCELEKLLNVDPAETPDVRQILGNDFDRVLESGLSILSPERIADLVKHPRMLLRLQEAVLIQGGDHWNRIEEADDTKSMVLREWKAIESRIGEPVRPSVNSSGKTGRRGALRILAGIAAAVAVGVTAWMVRPIPPTWGFDKSGLLTAEMPASDYLNTLAGAAEEWFKKRPEDSEGLAKRLRDFRHGCDTLLAAPHPQLAEVDKTWLLEKCRTWAGKIDGHLADLQSASKSVQVVRTEADETITKLVAALKARADQIG